MVYKHAWYIKNIMSDVKKDWDITVRIVLCLCLFYIVMCVILCVVGHFLSVNLLHMYTVCSLCMAPTFSLEGIKNFLN